MAEYISTLTGPEMDQALTDMNNHVSEAWAVGTRGGQAVQPTDETYQNNAKYYSEAAAAATEAVKDMTVSATPLAYGEDPTVTKTFDTDHYNLEFGLPLGATGEDADITSTEYGVSSSTSVQPTSWQTTIPSIQGGQFLWTKLTWNTGSVTYIVSRQGVDGTGTGDMAKSAYDPNNVVANAGGIEAYVASAIQAYITNNPILMSQVSQE